MESLLSGINSANLQMSVSAHNIANVSTDGYNAKRVIQTENSSTNGPTARVARTDQPTNLNEEIPNMMTAASYTKAYAGAIKIYTETQDTVLDMLA